MRNGWQWRNPPAHLSHFRNILQSNYKLIYPFSFIIHDAPHLYVQKRHFNLTTLLSLITRFIKKRMTERAIQLCSSSFHFTMSHTQMQCTLILNQCQLNQSAAFVGFTLLSTKLYAFNDFNRIHLIWFECQNYPDRQTWLIISAHFPFDFAECILASAHLFR